MSLSNIEVFCSGIFNFDIGEARQRFTLHRKLVSRHSEPLDRFMNYGLKESQLGVAAINDVEPGTFARFAEYIYSGDYSAAAPTVDETEDEETWDKRHEGTAQRGFRFGPWNPQSPEPEVVSSTADEPADVPQSVSPDFEAEEAPVETEGQAPDSPTESVPPEAPFPPVDDTQPPWPRSPTLADSFSTFQWAPGRKPKSPGSHVPFHLHPAPGPNQNSAMDYGPVFMCHAQVYLFAQRYIVPGLRVLAASKLSDSLKSFHCFPQRAADMSRFVEYVFRETPDADSTSGPLRELVVRYAATNFKPLVASTEFRNLLKEGGSFVPDLCMKVARML